MSKVTLAALACAFACATASAAPELRVLVGNDASDHMGSPIYLATERADIARAVVAFLGHAGHTVVPADDVAKLVLAARAGNNLATGAACGEAVSPRFAIEHELPGVQAAFAVVSCATKGGRDCTLVVTAGSAVYRAAVPAHPTSAQVAAAARRLRRTKPGGDEGGMFGIVGGVLAPGVLVMVTELNGRWPAAPDDALAAHQQAFDACLTDVRRTNVASPILLDVAPNGSVAACEPGDDDELPPPGFACLCKALGAVDFGASTGVRRLKLDVTHSAPDVTRANGKRVFVVEKSLTAADPTVLWAGTGISGHAVGQCLTGTEPLPAELPVQWHVDATGHPTSAIAALPGATQAIAHCLHRALAAATFACPQAGKPVDVTGVLSLIETK